MAIYVSDTSQVVFMYESGTYATTSGTSGNWLGLVTDHSPTDNENVMTVRYTGTNSRNVGILINGAKDYEGTITYHPQDFRMFTFALGSVLDAGSPSPYTHAITESNSADGNAFTSGPSHPFISFTIKDSKKGAADGFHQVRTYNGCSVDSLSLTLSQGEAVVCELGYKAQSLTLGSKTTDIVNILDKDTSRPYIWSDFKFHLESGTVMNEVTDLSLTITNNLEGRHYDNGSKVINSLIPTNRDYELSLTLDANSTWGKTLYEQYYQGGSEFNCMIEGVISAGSEQGFIMLSGCKISSFESPSPSEGINEYSLTAIPTSCNVNVDDLKLKYGAW